MNCIKQEVTVQVAPKRKRSKDEVCEMDTKANHQENIKKRQAKTLFRPWSEEQKAIKSQATIKTIDSPKSSPKNVAKTAPTPSSSPVQTAAPVVLPHAPNQSQIPFAAPVLPYNSVIPPFQLAIQQQQQHQAAMALQQAALYQRQIFMAHILARQQQQQQYQQHQHQFYQMQMRQHQLTQHQQQQQQMFAFGPQPGQK